jgi:alkanesulfonate monooxygenase SsuD/methylene tetrahydromethanopterin reductase-like flavin-dependent oxidoreductase (luciferase family)
VTDRVSLGLMVGANTFRNPALVVKMVTTLDHVSGGRAVLGIGSGWFAREHEAFGIDLGSGFGERLSWLDEAVELMHDMLRTGETTARGPRYRAQAVRNDPPPLQARLPILIGGGGERKTLRTVARFADIWDAEGDVDTLRHKDTVLRRWCDEIGRDQSEIERTFGIGELVIRSTATAARRAALAITERRDDRRRPDHVGTPDQIADLLRPYAQHGFRHIRIDAIPPGDHETLERFVREVKPRLEG